MPRLSNPTAYDDRMHVFKHDNRTRPSRATAHPPAAASSTYVAPERHRDVPTHVPSSSGHSVRSGPVLSPGGTVTYPWGDRVAAATPPLAPAAAVYGMNTNTSGGEYPMMPNTPFHENQTQNASSSSYQASAAPAGASRWVILGNNHTENPIYLPAERFQIPSSQCFCGATFRFVHLPTIAGQNWNSGVGVLWNFQVNEIHGWAEGRSNSTYVSQVVCPVCRIQLCLYGPYSSNS